MRLTQVRNEMDICAIDPGTEQSAMLCWDGSKISGARILPNWEICSLLTCNNDGRDSMLCIEMIASYGMPVGKETFETVLWIGRFMQAWHGETDTDAQLVYRRDIKMHHCGSMKAKDSNIRQALIDKYGAPGTKKNPGKTYELTKDLWQAFALATYVYETSKIALLK